MPDRPYHPAFDWTIPYYDRTPNNRAIRACTVKFVDATGIHLICPRGACRREGGCADRDMRALPFCWEHYRGLLRFLLAVAMRRRGADGSGSGGGDEEPVMPAPFRGEPLLARWAADGLPIAALARSVADGPDGADWEKIPAMCDYFRRLTGRA